MSMAKWLVEVRMKDNPCLQPWEPQPGEAHLQGGPDNEEADMAHRSRPNFKSMSKVSKMAYAWHILRLQPW